jgi:membrane protein
VSSFLQQVGSELNIDEEGIAALTDTVNASSTQASMGLIGFFSLAFAAVLVFVALQDAFDELWGLPVARGFRKRIHRRRKAFLVAGGAWIALVLALAINALADFMKQVIPGEDTLLDEIPDLFRVVSGWVVMFAALAVIYQMLTRKKICSSALVVGSLATASLLAVGTQVLDWYLANYASTSLSGAIGSVLVALLWLYYIAQMILIGANLIRVLDERRSGQLAQVKAG